METPTKKNIETEDLIRLVRDRKCLWDRSHPSYRNREEKEKAWNEVYREIEPDYDQCTSEMKNLIGLQITRKWYNVRDSYVKSRKTLNLRHKPYLHAKLLRFLEPIYFEDNQDKRDEEKSDHDEPPDQWLSQVFVVDDDEENIGHEAKRPKLDIFNDKPKENASVEVDDSLVNVLATMINKEDDDDRAFFKSILPAVKSLSVDSKFEFRIQLMNILRGLMHKEKVVVEFKQEDDGRSSCAELD